MNWADFMIAIKQGLIASKESVDAKLDKSGGDLTGNLNTKHVYPTSNTVFNIGSHNLAYNYAYLAKLFLYANGVNYGRFGADTIGTTSVDGISTIVVGNPIASGTTGNASGTCRLYGAKNGYSDIVPSNNTASNITLNLPSTSGTLALQEETLPLTGGTVNGFTKIEHGSSTPFSVQNTTGDTAYIAYSNASELLGMLGFKEKDKPIMYTADWTKQLELLHTGNKPIGSYTGNGNGATRTINITTSGISRVLQIHSSKGIAIVASSVAIAIMANGSAKFYASGSFGSFGDGNLTLWTTDEAFNANGEAYYYQVL